MELWEQGSGHHAERVYLGQAAKGRRDASQSVPSSPSSSLCPRTTPISTNIISLRGSSGGSGWSECIFTGKKKVTQRPSQRRTAQKKAQGRFFLLGDLWMNDCSLNINEIRKEDEGSYFFRLERGKTKFNYLWNKMTLNVTALTNTPHILLPETLEAGHPSNLTCSVPWDCKGSAHPIFSWTGTSVSFLNTNTTGSPVLTVIPQPQDHGANLTCQVTLPGTGQVTTRMTVRLNVSYAPKNLTVTIYQGGDSVSTILENGSSVPISEDQPLRLICSTDSYPPANLSWSWNNLTLCPSKLSKPGLLELFSVHLKHGGVYTCQAQHALGSQHISLHLSPQSSATLSEMMMGTLVGSGVTALLSLSFCIILLAVRSYRRKPARPTVVALHPNALKASVSQSPLVESQADDSSEPLPSTVEVASFSTEEEIHYASLSFHEMKPRNPRGQQDTTTEYSEIKFHK
ncbi:sialic acid-binding Ig-like lectin 12 isoform X2 [Grammomys surdaster]|uniref:sialic acid-binding Ig-like lectin 12 isoform X2 n=1 Tax=Grammomys surdaster TaxID=491861 RepID=UPI00109EEE94|nr:sialic acid-binding Ig-like lectin 12 isoform X2 [Grammomys surdaster]